MESVTERVRKKVWAKTTPSDFGHVQEQIMCWGSWASTNSEWNLLLNVSEKKLERKHLHPISDTFSNTFSTEFRNLRTNAEWNMLLNVSEKRFERKPLRPNSDKLSNRFCAGVSKNRLGHIRQNRLGNTWRNRSGTIRRNRLGNIWRNRLGNIRRNRFGNIWQNWLGTIRRNRLENTRQNRLGTIWRNRLWKIGRNLQDIADGIDLSQLTPSSNSARCTKNCWNHYRRSYQGLHSFVWEPMRARNLFHTFAIFEKIEKQRLTKTVLGRQRFDWEAHFGRFSRVRKIIDFSMPFGASRTR